MPEIKWQIEYLEISPKNIPVYDFINDLEVNARAKVYNTLELLSEFGTKLSPPHCKKLTGTLFYELRILGQNNLRVLYLAVSGHKFLLVHGFTKKSEKTPLKEIKTATRRYEKWQLDNIAKL